MLGCYDFCGHYDWTFEWLRQQGGEALLRDYWSGAIAVDSQRHAAAMIKELGFEGMKKYWAHTLNEEAAGYVITSRENVFRVDMHECPSKGFLIRNGIEHSADYCDHCIEWIGPMLKPAGFTIDHEHNHQGQCWWEMRKKDDATPPSRSGEISGEADIRHSAEWCAGQKDVFEKSVSVADKKPAVS